MKSCIFHNNTSDSYFNRKPFQGSSGGLSIGYYYDLFKIQLNNINILVINCKFTYNAAILFAGQGGTTDEVLTTDIFFGRGGAFSILVNLNSTLKFTFNDSTFMYNYADAFGGSMYCLTITDSNQMYTFSNNVFMNNAGQAVGGLSLNYQLNSSSEFSVNYLIYNCIFYNNSAVSTVAGAVAIYPVLGLASSITIKFDNCGFYDNTAVIYGGAVDILSYNFFDNIEVAFPIEFIDWLEYRDMLCK